MRLEPLREPDRVAIAGDWHRNTDWAVRMIERAHREFADTILHLGDFGYWSGGDTEHYLDTLQQALLNDMTFLLWIDGNHEDHERIEDLPSDASGLHPIRPNIWHIPRGFRWHWHGKTWLALGGAASVDRKFRTPGLDWFPGELITLADIDRATAGGHADVMLTHDCPTGVDTPWLDDPRIWPVTDMATACHNRDALRLAVEDVRPTVLYHGHYHHRYSAELVTPNYITRIEGLDRDKAATESDNMIILDL